MKHHKNTHTQNIYTDSGEGKNHRMMYGTCYWSRHKRWCCLPNNNNTKKSFFWTIQKTNRRRRRCSYLITPHKFFSVSCLMHMLTVWNHERNAHFLTFFVRLLCFLVDDWKIVFFFVEMHAWAWAPDRSSLTERLLHTILSNEKWFEMENPLFIIIYLESISINSVECIRMRRQILKCFLRALGDDLIAQKSAI